MGARLRAHRIESIEVFQAALGKRTQAALDRVNTRINDLSNFRSVKSGGIEQDHIGAAFSPGIAFVCAFRKALSPVVRGSNKMRTMFLLLRVIHVQQRCD
jgi:hypothetical protein